MFRRLLFHLDSPLIQSNIGAQSPFHGAVERYKFSKRCVTGRKFNRAYWLDASSYNNIPCEPGRREPGPRMEKREALSLSTRARKSISNRNKNWAAISLCRRAKACGARLLKFNGIWKYIMQFYMRRLLKIQPHQYIAQRSLSSVDRGGRNKQIWRWSVKMAACAFLWKYALSNKNMIIFAPWLCLFDF